MITIQSVQLSKSYGFYKIFEDLSFSIPAGECFALFGPNGAGKTTLLQVLATLTRPTSGRFEILGYDGITEKPAIRNSVMVLAHGSYLYDDLNAVENIQFASALRGKSPTFQEITRALDFVNIGAFRDLKIRFFSAGMKKRLGLAKVFLIQPKVLFLDEPYNALDDAGVGITNDLIRDLLKKGGTAFMTTHDRIKATQVASQTGILRQGTLHPFNLESQTTNDLS
ncbi:MAG: heme ABC exporter ATP-binding protein CcmA [Nitrospirota bacterium]|nr:MAG: heme ABC exporter ATP-binding protein CcmA [Nitrospirota bacterium]